jgi:hypothetical protein
MTLRFRRWLFAGFCLAFVVMAVLILPYAFGYKLDGRGWKLQKTGMFVIETKPKGAQIYLNDKLQTSQLLVWSGDQDKAIQTPAKLSHIIPGNYRVRLELEGYWPWEKELAVRAGESTYLEDVRFFKHNLPELLFASQSAKPELNSVSPDKTWLAYKNDKELKFYNLETEQNNPVATGSFSGLSWSSDSRWLMADLLAINTQDGSQLDLRSLDKNISSPVWPGLATNQLCYQNPSGVWQLDLTTKKSTLLLAKNKQMVVSDCLIKDNYSFLVRQNGKQSELVIVKSGDGKELGVINLPRLANYQLIDEESEVINVWDANSHKLIVVNINLPWTNNYNVQTIDNPVNHSQWIDDKRLLYASDFEIWMYNLADNKNTLLTRVSHQINNIFWHPSQNYIVFATDQDISSLELDNRERHNITKLLEMKLTGQAEMGKEARAISFFGQLGQQSGYWQLEL